MSDSKRDEHLWNQFIKLGDMIGDGLHNEPDGKWISKEYRRISKILLPENEVDKQYRKYKNEYIDLQMAELSEKTKCNCGGSIKQKRSGTKVAYCQKCNARYVAHSRKITTKTHN